MKIIFANNFIKTQPHRMQVYVQKKLRSLS